MTKNDIEKMIKISDSYYTLYSKMKKLYPNMGEFNVYMGMARIMWINK